MQGRVPNEYRGRLFFVHGSECGDGDNPSVFSYQIHEGCELRFDPALEEHNGEMKLQAKRVTHYLCPNCPDNSQSLPPPKRVRERPPPPVGQAIKKKQEQKKEAKKPSQQPKADREPKKGKKVRRLGTTRAGPRKGKRD